MYLSWFTFASVDFGSYRVYFDFFLFCFARTLAPFSVSDLPLFSGACLKSISAALPSPVVLKKTGI